MKKFIAKYFKFDKKTFLFLTIISIIGLITGAIFMCILNLNDKETILSSLNNYLNGLNKLNITSKTYINNFIINILYAFIIWIIGISVIGIPAVLIIIFFKSFLISFTISSFIINYKLKGIVYSLAYIFPHDIINLLLYIYLGILAIKLSSSIITAIINKKTINFKNNMMFYFKVFIIIFVCIIFTTFFETYIMPNILKNIIRIIN